MSKLEQLTPNAAVRGVLPDGLVTVVNVQWFGSEALELTYKSPNGKVANELLYRHDEERIEVVELGRPWSFDGDGGVFRLVSDQLIRALEAGGESAAASLVAKLGGNAELARELAYRLYTVAERKKRATEALSYNALVQSWPEITRLARAEAVPVEPAQAALL
jgi:hypothetical protein